MPREFRNLHFINQNNNCVSFDLRASAVISVEDKYLMVFNKLANKYKHPGGHLYLHESLIDGLKRELKEEIGLVIDNVNLQEVFFLIRFT